MRLGADRAHRGHSPGRKLDCECLHSPRPVWAAATAAQAGDRINVRYCDDDGNQAYHETIS